MIALRAGRVALPAPTSPPPCTEVDAELFFPDHASGARLSEIRALCSHCPVWEECLTYAMANDVIGVWGGTTYAQRRAVRRRTGLVARPVILDDHRFPTRDHLTEGAA